MIDFEPPKSSQVVISSKSLLKLPQTTSLEIIFESKRTEISQSLWVKTYTVTQFFVMIMLELMRATWKMKYFVSKPTKRKYVCEDDKCEIGKTLFLFENWVIN